jgi:bacterioferritin-associated ferredoxin
MYVCLCNGVTDHEIRQVAEAGCRTLSELTMRTGCGASCGSCVEMATHLLDEVHAARPLPSAALSVAVLPLPMLSHAA